DVGPRDTAAPAGPENFQHCFLRRESAGEMLEIALDVSRAIDLLGGRVDAIEEALAVLFDAAADARGLDDIDAVSEDRHERKDTRERSGLTLCTCGSILG